MKTFKNQTRLKPAQNGKTSSKRENQLKTGWFVFLAISPDKTATYRN
jgi:hypothetical protein